MLRSDLKREELFKPIDVELKQLKIWRKKKTGGWFQNLDTVGMSEN